MQLTDRPRARSSALLREPEAPGWLWLVVLGALASIFLLDHWTASAPVQHLYYLPIILASTRLGARGGGVATTASVALYHLANPHLLTFQYVERDVVQIALFIAVGITSTKLASDARRLRRFATTDDLTGLHNLRSFEARLATLVGTARPGSSLALLVLDVDHLKSLNDQHGHLTGAEAVRTVGHIIAGAVPADAVACRYGGDEFVIALPDCGEARARTIADELRGAVEACAPVLATAPFPRGTLTISIGVACHTFGGGGRPRERGPEAGLGDRLFRSADDALYAAKRGGRNRVEVAGPIEPAR